ncbi:MAG: hypothetical protein K6T59_06485, partial [Bryobacteraceae bacterium]|nr:hypothetical protein [Bryobacteraceae bacterium]
MSPLHRPAFAILRDCLRREPVPEGLKPVIHRVLGKPSGLLGDRGSQRRRHRLGIRRPFLHEVALEVVNLMGDQYPELREREALIASTAEQEEVRFRETID